MRHTDPPSDPDLPYLRRRWTVERWLLVLTFIGTLVIGIFGLGAQWNATTNIRATVNAIQRDYVRADVYAADQRRLSDAIERLTRVLDGQGYAPAAAERRLRPRVTPDGRTVD